MKAMILAAGVVGRVVDHDEVGGRGRPGETAKIDVAIDVAIDYEKRLVAEQGQGVGDAAGGFQRAWRFRRIADSQTPL